MPDAPKPSIRGSRAFGTPRTKKTRVSPALLHWRKKRSAENVLAKLNTFSGPHKIPQVLTYLRKLDPFVFEELLLTVLEQAGYMVRRNRRYTGDGGVDGILYDREGVQVLVQAKRYTNYVRPADVDAFARLVEASKAEYGLFIHTGKSGPGTRVKKTQAVAIVSGNHLVRLLLEPQTTFLKRR